MRRGSSLATSFALASMLFISGCPRPERQLEIGVLMDLTGPDFGETRQTLDWIAAEVNSSGALGAREVRLVYEDSFGGDIRAAAGRLLADPAVRIVVGPQRSVDLFEIAPLFIERRKLLISPTATAGQVMRAYADTGYIWRTCESDVAQVRAILEELSSRGAKRLALVYPEDEYGRTFYEWTGFFCIELGIELVGLVGFEAGDDLEKVVEAATESGVDYILAAAFAVEAAGLKRIVDRRRDGTKIFFTDAAENPYLIEELGAEAEGLELMAPAADPRSGFEEAYAAALGRAALGSEAAICDAFLCAVYTLVRQDRLRLFGREGLDVSFRKIVSGSGKVYSWDRFAEAIRDIAAGRLPDIEGAATSLRFDGTHGVDPVDGHYSLRRIEGKEGVIDFRTISRYSSDASTGIGRLDEGASVARTLAGGQGLAIEEPAGVQSSAPRSELWAVLAATSSGWNNYRHQADALAVYDLLKKNGLPDERIILISADDVPWTPENSRRGEIRHEPKGPDLRKTAKVDYSGEAATEETLKKVMLGLVSEKAPTVLGSDGRSDLFVYLVGHGEPGALDFADGSSITATELAELAADMRERKKFARAFIMAETCFGESLGEKLDVPGLLFFTGASRMEPSFASRYDRSLRQWLADNFTAQALERMVDPRITLERLYIETYGDVVGSHVKLMNVGKFGDIEIPIADFIRP